MSDSEEHKSRTKGSGKSGTAHIKWFAIIMGILIVLMVIFLDYCTRTGHI